MHCGESPVSCLILNSDVGSCMVLRKLATALGYDCDVVHNMPDGLRAVVAKHYNIVLISCLVQDRTCWITHQAIKLLHREKKCPAVIGVLSCSDSAMQQRCEASGMAGVVFQPVSKEQLLARIGNKAPSIECKDVRAQRSASPCTKQAISEESVPPAEPTVSQMSEQTCSDALNLGIMELHEAGPLSLGELNSK